MGTEPQSGLAGAGAIERANPAGTAAPQICADPALVPVPPEIPDGAAGEQHGPAFRRIPVQVDVAVPIRRFRVRDVLALDKGQVIATRWIEGEDMPLAAHGTQLAWAEIEVIDQKLAVRITRLV